MARWFFCISLFLSSLILLAAATRERPPEVRLAVLDSEAVFARDPVARGLIALNRHNARMQRRRVDARAQLARAMAGMHPAADLDPLPDFNPHRELFYDMQKQGFTQDMLVSMSAAQFDFEAGMRDSYQSLLDRMDTAVAGLEKEIFTDTGELDQARFRLFNLRLKLDLLSDDDMVMSAEDRRKYQQEVDELTAAIRRDQRRREEEFIAREQKVYEGLQQELQDTVAQRKQEFQEQIDLRIRRLEAELEGEAAQYEQDFARQSQERHARRERFRATMRAANEHAALPGPGSEPDDALPAYREKFFKDLAPEIEAAAQDVDAHLVVREPLYHSPQVVDITGRF